MEFGLEMHEALELIDFINPNLSLIDNTFIQNKINMLKTIDTIIKMIYNVAKIKERGVTNVLFNVNRTI